MTNTMVLAVVAIVVLIVAIMLFKIILGNQDGNKAQKAQAIKNLHKELVKIKLPKVIETMDHKDLRSHAEELMKTYKALDYQEKSRKELDQIEWNSWEVSIIIMMYKNDFALFVPQYKKFFPKDIVDNSVYSLEFRLHPLFDKYKKEVTLTGSEVYLKDQVIWSSFEMSVLLLFLSKYQSNYPSDL